MFLEHRDVYAMSILNCSYIFAARCVLNARREVAVLAFQLAQAPSSKLRMDDTTPTAPSSIPKHQMFNRLS